MDVPYKPGPNRICGDFAMRSPSLPNNVLLRLTLLIGCAIMCFRGVMAEVSHRSLVTNCLNGEPGSGSFNWNDAKCSGDPLRIADDAVIQATESLLNLQRSQIRFNGCVQAPFTSSLSATQSVCVVTYPLESTSVGPYKGALLHELGHCFQLRQAGDRDALMERAKGSAERIELGADFLAGLACRHSGLGQGEFVRSVRLVGSYTSKDPDWHGQPEDRAGAFRQGYHYPLNALSIVDAYKDFQDNRFSEIANHEVHRETK